MKVVILAGGKGSRMQEGDFKRPKPLVEIGSKPILWHLIQLYAAQGFTEFIIALGHYKDELLKELPAAFPITNQQSLNDPNLPGVLQFRAGEMSITMADTGLETMTSGRLQRLQPYLQDDTFMMTYADGLSDIDLQQLLTYHQRHQKIATVTAINPENKYGVMRLSEGDVVKAFIEVDVMDDTWINGGFFVLEPAVFQYLREDAAAIMWEDQPMQDLIQAQELVAYRHRGAWKCMDTQADARELNRLFRSSPFWKKW